MPGKTPGRVTDPAMPSRVLLAGLFHETHTFLATPTTLADFEVCRGEELLGKAGDGSPLAGFLAVAADAGWEVVPAIDLRALPSGLVDDAVLDLFWAELSATLDRESSAGLDALFLVLHGAMVTASHRDVEGEILRRLRARPDVRDAPIFVVLDLHANVSPAMARHANALIAYRENPHTDARATAVRAAELLKETLRDQRVLRTHWRRAPIVWPPPGTGTADSPMRELEAAARRIETSDPRINVVNVIAGFSFADTPFTGVSFSLVGELPEAEAQEHLTQLCRLAWQHRAAGNVTYPPVEDVLHSVLPVDRGPVLLVEPSDNIGGGAPGDGTGVLRALLDCDARDAAVAINDPAAVALLQSLTPGATRRLAVGGRGSPLDPGPVTLEVELLSTSNGRFTLEDPHSHLASMSGLQVDMGSCAVVRHGGITLLLTSRKTPPFDLGQWRSQALDPRRFKLIGVKAAVAHRRAYDPIAAASYFVDTPGPCSSNLARFPFHHLSRHLYPFAETGLTPDGTQD